MLGDCLIERRQLGNLLGLPTPRSASHLVVAAEVIDEVENLRAGGPEWTDVAKPVSEPMTPLALSRSRASARFRPLWCALALSAGLLAFTGTVQAASASGRAVVDHVVDGDTIEVRIRGREEYVRFVGIDTPEVFGGVECGGPEASASMNRMLQPGDRVKLVRDRSQDNRDY